MKIERWIKVKTIKPLTFELVSESAIYMYDTHGLPPEHVRNIIVDIINKATTLEKRLAVITNLLGGVDEICKLDDGERQAILNDSAVNTEDGMEQYTKYYKEKYKK